MSMDNAATFYVVGGIVMKFYIAILIILSSFNIRAGSLSLGYYEGERDVNGLSFTYRPDYKVPLSKLPFMDGSIDELAIEASFHILKNLSSAKNSDNVVLAITPIWSRQVATLKQKPIVIDFGIGISLLKDKYFAGKNLGTHFQFEDKLGVTLKLNNDKAISLRYVHYSNGGISDNNPGLDFLNLAYTFSW